MSQREIRQERLRKLEELKEAGINPYPSRVLRSETIANFLSQFPSRQESGENISLAGRVMSRREHGGIIFADLFDGEGRVQLVLKKGKIDEKLFELFEHIVDPGDFISATGVAFTTKRGERSLQTLSWQMAAKSLLPLPSEWYGIKDEEARYRQRYLDILLQPETRALFERRSQFWHVIRTFLSERGFMEVETPTLETKPGGADARAFETHHNALDIDLYLRIATGELWQKRLLVAGFQKIFEIGRIFRNEGMSYEHLQDYTQMELYKAFADCEEGMGLVQELYRSIARAVYGKTLFTVREHTFNLADEWKHIDYAQIMKENYSLDPIICSEKEARAAVERAGLNKEKEELNKERAVDMLWKNVRKSIAGPAFLTGTPVYLAPLAKRSPKNTETVERFQVILAGSEMGNGYSELNDPLDQRVRFEAQQKLREEGDEEAQRMDESFVEALEYGMPPALGFGVSERLFSFLENKSVREAQFFPLMRPQSDPNKIGNKNRKNI